MGQFERLEMEVGGKFHISKPFKEYLKKMNIKAFEVAAYVLDKRNTQEESI